MKKEYNKIKKKKRIVDPWGKMYRNAKEMCRDRGVSYSTFVKRRKRGMSMADALTPTMCQDHKGKLYTSMREMAEENDKDYQLIRGRIHNGWSIERALTEDKKECSGAIPVRDHTGKEFPSIRALCRHYGINERVYRYRRSVGYSMEDTLCMPLNSGRKSAPHEIRDHLGNMFPSIKAKCEAYNISYVLYSNRKKAGWTEQKALTAPKAARPSKGIVYDHEGNRFDNLNRMCKAYHIEPITFRSRMKLGWSLEDALTRPVDEKHRRKNPLQ